MAYKLLFHNEIDLKGLEKNFLKTIRQLQDADFKSADVRKMGATNFYRARLNLKDRLLFKPVKHNGTTFLLLLEWIKDHNYARSRFLRGALLPPDDQLVPVPALADSTVAHLSYLNPGTHRIHVLNKFISFDEIQESVIDIQPPLIIIGSAGSGKTALVLEKLKLLTGNVAYISLSKFLVESASKMYYAQGYENEDQEVDFLSLTDYLASWGKPEGKEIHFRLFEQWLSRYSQALKINEPYRVFEEFKGVITGSPVHTGWLSEEEYFALGVKQSVFSLAERERLYPLFLKYLLWLKENNLYDSNIICFEHLKKITPRYQFVVVDEVQDITNIQLKSILQSLQYKNNFILTGDSNQIVHPNLFSWSKVKSYFYLSNDDLTDYETQIKILQTNYRNSLQVVELSNRLLKIKNSRFGSIDKESTYLINTISNNKGEVLLYPNDEKKKQELNRRTQDSKDFAVIVSDTIYKDEVRKYFKTPLIFSIQEAKGLEYENVILANFISNHEDEFREIISGVTENEIEKGELNYSRAANKHDKDAEIYKFYINSFYVAITRAVKNIYLFESKISHPILSLLRLSETKSEIRVAQATSSRQEWLEEARRLREQGKFEQAEQIMARYLGYEYISEEQLEGIVKLALDPAKNENEVKKERKQLFEYAVHHQRFDWLEHLAKLQLQRAVVFMKEVRQHRKEYSKNVRLGRLHEAMVTVKKFGIDFTNEEGVSGLMLALYHDQKALAAELVRQGASIVKRDHQENSAATFILQGYYKKILHKQQQVTSSDTFKMFWYAVRPSVIKYEIGGRRFQVNGHSMQYYLITVMQAMQSYQPNKVEFKGTKEESKRKVLGAFQVTDFLNFVSHIPEEVLPEYRKQRPYINAVLATNEVSQGDKSFCKYLFRRIQRGWYVINPDIKWITED
jgi:superfamily I DNA/RNA helicase